MKNLFAYIKKAFAAFLILLSANVYGQTTGSFDTTITFAGAGRQLSVYVPTNYNAANKYNLMVCLHGLGDNSGNYRNALVNSLNWKAQFPNTIFVCPESSTTTADYHAPDGSNNEEIIRQSITFATNNYSIDTNEVILQGFSLGGRAALRFGLNNPNLFKGILLNTPAVQGVKEGSNKQPTYPYNFANANRVPVYISHGGADELYTAPIDSIIEKLIENDCPLFFNRIAGMGHTIPGQATLGDFNAFFSTPATRTYGIEVARVRLPLRTCANTFNGGILVRNTGATTIQQIDWQYTLNGGAPVNISSTNLNLAPYQHAIIPITNFAVGATEVQTFSAKAVTINGNIGTDTLPVVANTATGTFVYQNKGKTLPYFEGFDGNDFPPQGWALNPSGDIFSSWYRDDDVKKTGAASLNAINTVLIFDNTTRFEEIQSPSLDLTSLPNPHITFDYAYNYHKFKAGNDSAQFADTLEVLVSTDCGATFSRIYKGGGADLATFTEPILNPNTIEKCYGPNPTAQNWKTAYFPLANYATSNAAIISIRYHSALGGCINIDNVSFANNPLSVTQPTEKVISLYPNPAQNNVYVQAEGIESINVFDISGKQIAVDTQNITENAVLVNTQNLAAGIYYVQVAGEGYTQNQKLVIQK